MSPTVTYAAGLTLWDAFVPSLIMAVCLLAVLPWLDREHPLTRALVVGIMTLLMLRYLVWRVVDTLPPVGLTANFLIGIVFTSVEALMLAGAVPSLIYLSRIRNRSAEADANISWVLDRAHVPWIDVLICTYNEDETILERTIVGALAMTYPNFRVWVCDDGRRTAIADLCHRLGCGYIARNDNLHAKAGNINNALRTVMALPQPPEFISVLDADFVVFPHFLTRAVALMREPDVGIVQTPQHFRNPDPIQANLLLSRAWPDEQRYFFDILLAGKDAWNVAFCCGTSSVIRVAPLMTIGGFPTDSVTEDLLLSVRTAEAGFRTVYLNERLSLGLSPEGMREYVLQRGRWCLGFMQVFCGRSAPLSWRNNVPWRYRIMLVELFVHWVTAYLFRLMSIVIPSFYFFFDIQAVQAKAIDAVVYFVPYILFQIIGLAWLTRGNVLPLLTDVGQVLTAREVTRAVWQGLTKPQGHKFSVTPKGGDRSRKLVQWPMLKFFLLLAGLNAGALAWRFLFDDDRGFTDSAGMSLFWCWYNLVLLTLACGVAIERPRRRDDRFPTTETVHVSIDGGPSVAYTAIDIAVGGVKLHGTAPARIGSTASVQLSGTAVEGQVIRSGNANFTIQFDTSSAARAQMMRHVFSGRYSANVPKVRAPLILAGLAKRVVAD